MDDLAIRMYVAILEYYIGISQLQKATFTMVYNACKPEYTT